MRMPVPADDYRSYAELARDHCEGRDYVVEVRRVPGSAVAILAPHGGRIEGGTSEVARQIAGCEHSLYLFEGRRATGDNFDRLHLTSHCFDEPRCLDLLASAGTVVAIHGYAAPGPEVLLGGLDEALKEALARALRQEGLQCLADGHRFPGRDPQNVCNRGASRRGVQLELSARLRRSRDWSALTGAVRGVLAEWVAPGSGLPGKASRG